MNQIEHFCQTFCVSFLHKLQLAGCDFLVWSTPNGGSRNKAEAGRLKLEGTLSFIASATRYGFGVTVVVGDTVSEVLPQVMVVMERIFGIPQNEMSSISAKILEDAARFSGGRITPKRP